MLRDDGLRMRARGVQCYWDKLHTMQAGWYGMVWWAVVQMDQVHYPIATIFSIIFLITNFLFCRCLYSYFEFFS